MANHIYIYHTYGSYWNLISGKFPPPKTMEYFRPGAGRSWRATAIRPRIAPGIRPSPKTASWAFKNTWGWRGWMGWDGWMRGLWDERWKDGMRLAFGWDFMELFQLIASLKPSGPRFMNKSNTFHPGFRLKLLAGWRWWMIEEMVMDDRSVVRSRAIPRSYLGVSIDGGTPSHHPFLDGIFHEINHPASWGTPILGNPHI